MDPATIMRKAEEESNIWFELNYPDASPTAPTQPSRAIKPSWKAPADDILKCNIAASWSESSRKSGAAWFVRDSRGKVLVHGRRSYSFVQTREQEELLAIFWEIESMKSMRKGQVIFESSCERARACFLSPNSCHGAVELVGKICDMVQWFQFWSLDHVLEARNVLAQRIANSVISERRYQSYIAFGGPNWLKDLIAYEARNATPSP
ncbi:uncharacterized protein LOC106442202 [Brassica napus]|uniref:uncharacterized protein LOC106303069 n=1 Tax=Brassica oleracea var. oleracea TaxID=109376 RepID=UPI0006A71C50|nr:PREDICTED: uncharacterized protein LOC106303069 [Brassica oleracea var. oleracea]XP_013739370.1 uncharacterized protein LOC106442202 [Brassica napus]